MREKDLTDQMASFGDYIAARRKALNLKQKDLSAKIRKEDGTHISIPYLHDVEAGKRNPPSDDMIEQLGTILDVPVDILYFYAERLPADLKKFDVPEAQILAAFEAFRRELFAGGKKKKRR
jgi:transcriptional regulator with XRE-family HTH domain